MAGVEFDEAAAGRLIRAADSSAELLRGQGTDRRAAAEDAATDFAGAYAARFTEAAVVESADRPKLAGVLEDLSAQVAVVKEEAEREDQRRSDLEAWTAREAARTQALAEAPDRLLLVPEVLVLDPRPSTTEVRPTTIEATFSPRERPRAGGGSAGGKSSADPAALRAFATRSRAADAAADDSAASLRAAWTGFTGSCSWARVGSATFLDGFDGLLAENEGDAAWLERIAEAFERAGGSGSLTDAVLDIASAELPDELRQLFAGGLDATQVAARWSALGWTRADAADLRALPTSVLSQLGNLEGVPYWARDTANRTVLDDRIAEQERHLDDLLASDEYDVAGSRYGAAHEQLRALQEIEKALRQGSRAGARSLVSLTADEPPLAAVSIGDLDDAENVTWAVPGMGSSTADMTGWTSAAQNIFDVQIETGGPEDRAVIAWMGYDAPPVPGTGNLDPGVLGSGRAEEGGVALGASVRGLAAVRSDMPPTTNVVAHSYGTTTAAYGLIEEGVHVDTFTTIASAGIPDEIDHAGQIHADAMYSGQARAMIPILEHGKGDEWAAVGRDFSVDHHQDPMDDDFGSTTFGTDGSTGMVGVTDHGVHTDGSSGYLDPNTESLWNVGYATTGHPEKMTAHVPQGPTTLQRALLDGASGSLP